MNFKSKKNFQKDLFDTKTITDFQVIQKYTVTREQRESLGEEAESDDDDSFDLNPKALTSKKIKKSLCK